MRTTFLFMMTSIDGYYEGPGHDLSWHNTDAEFDDFVREQNSGVGTVLFGRRTYEMMASYWGNDDAYSENPAEVVDFMRNVEKVVFSRTLERADWQNTRLVRENAAGEVRRLKESGNGDIAVFGSGILATSLLTDGVLDELRIMVAPVALGAGTPLFSGLGEQRKFQLASTRTFGNGNVLHIYR